MVDYTTSTFPTSATLQGHSLATDPHSTLHGNLGAAALDLNARRVSYYRGFGHSWGTTGGSGLVLGVASQYVGLELFASQLHVPDRNQSLNNVWGQLTLQGNLSTVGQVLQSKTFWNTTGPPAAPLFGTPHTGIPQANPDRSVVSSYNLGTGVAYNGYTKQMLPPRGLTVIICGSSDINTNCDTSGKYDQCIAALPWAFRSIIARAQMARVYESDEYNISGGNGITYNSGTWTHNNTSSVNHSGSYYSKCTDAGQLTIATGSNFPGGRVDVGFLTNSQGRSIVPGSTVTITVDSAAAQFVTGGNTIDTSALNPNYANEAGHATVSFPVTSGNHSIVVSCGAGGMTFDFWGVRADTPYANPVIVCNSSKLPAGTEGNLTDARVNAFNSMLTTVAAENTNVVVADVATWINKDAKYYWWDNLHFNDWGQARVLGALWAAFGTLTLDPSLVPFI